MGCAQYGVTIFCWYQVTNKLCAEIIEKTEICDSLAFQWYMVLYGLIKNCGCDKSLKKGVFFRLSPTLRAIKGWTCGIQFDMKWIWSFVLSMKGVMEGHSSYKQISQELAWFYICLSQVLGWIWDPLIAPWLGCQKFENAMRPQKRDRESVLVCLYLYSKNFLAKSWKLAVKNYAKL